MFKKSRAKIVIAIMSVLVLLWVGTLGVIYISSYIEMYEQNRKMLEEHVNMYELSTGMTEPPPISPMPKEGNHIFMDSPRFQLSIFYSVAIDFNGDLLEIKNDKPFIYSDKELMEIAYDILNGDKQTGIEGNLVYYKADKGGYFLVAFMDNTIINESAATLFRYTFIFGGMALIAFFVLAIFMARKIVEPLEENYKKHKQFISDAGHELKTPISVVNANAELLSREIGDNKWLDNIQYENERMGNLVSQMLELARTEKVSIDMEKVELSYIVNGEMLPFESMAYEKGFNLVCKIEENIEVVGNSNQLKQLINILLDNAMSHCDGEKNINISLSHKKSHAIFSVSNPGKEISEDDKKHLFDRFYRVDEARTGCNKHYGLGLAIAKSIVHLHKGKIEVICNDGLVEFIVQIPCKKIKI